MWPKTNTPPQICKHSSHRPYAYSITITLLCSTITIKMLPSSFCFCYTHRAKSRIITGPNNIRKQVTVIQDRPQDHCTFKFALIIGTKVKKKFKSFLQKGDIGKQQKSFRSYISIASTFRRVRTKNV